MRKVLFLGLLLAGTVLFTGCGESLQRSMKTFSSEYGGGLNRVVSVYANDGTLLRTYKGNLDIESTEYGNKVLFDLNGKRVIIYNATVIVEEVGVQTAVTQ